MTRTRNTFLALVVALLSPIAANAYPITISGYGAADGMWDVTLLGPTSYNASSAALESQIWWGNAALARYFSDLVNTALGRANTFVGFGPQFAFDPNSSFAWDFNDQRTEGWGYPTSNLWTFAVANRVSVPEPGTLVLFSIGLLGMGVAGRRKA